VRSCAQLFSIHIPEIGTSLAVNCSYIYKTGFTGTTGFLEKKPVRHGPVPVFRKGAPVRNICYRYLHFAHSKAEYIQGRFYAGARGPGPPVAAQAPPPVSFNALSRWNWIARNRGWEVGTRPPEFLD
jgi:hypothetical protein